MIGDGYTWTVWWTFVGAIVPGVGLLAAGRRRSGTFFVSLFALGLGALAALILVGDPTSLGLRVGTDSNGLLALAGASVAVAAFWTAVLLASNRALRTMTPLRPMQRFGNRLLVVALVVGIALPAYSGVHAAVITRGLVASMFTGNAQATLPKGDPWANLPRVNVLLIGSDAGKGRVGDRTDTMIVASINTSTGDTVLFSLPRNLMNAPFPNGSAGNDAWPNGFTCDDCELNAVYKWGVEHPERYPGAPDAGIAALDSAIEGVTGLRIAHNVTVNLSGFESVVDALGGITVNVPKRLPIGGGTNTLTGRPNKIYGYIEAGQNQRLDGHEALWFARSRANTDDYDRMRRQRCVIGAITAEADPLTLVSRYPALAASAKENISTDIPAADLNAWAELAVKIKGAGIRSLPFTSDVIRSADPDFDKIRSTIAAELDPPAAAPASSATATTATPKPTTSSSTAPPADPGTSARLDQVC